jgi:hypothetical protein
MSRLREMGHRPRDLPASLPTTSPVLGARHGGSSAPSKSCRDNHVKLHLDRPGATTLITAFDRGSVMVNQTRYSASMIVMSDRMNESWAPRTFDALTDGDFETLAGLGADIVLLGTGRTLRFPHPRLTSRLLARRIGLEAMDTAPACRTYNILSGEGRNVAAALIIE